MLENVEQFNIRNNVYKNLYMSYFIKLLNFLLDYSITATHQNVL